MATEWFVRIGTVEHGPIASDALKQFALQGKVTPDTLVKKGVSGDWVPASRVKGLFVTTTGNTVSPPVLQTTQPIPQNMGEELDGFLERLTLQGKITSDTSVKKGAMGTGAPAGVVQSPVPENQGPSDDPSSDGIPQWMWRLMRVAFLFLCALVIFAVFGDNYPFPSATIRIPFQIPEV